MEDINYYLKNPEILETIINLRYWEILSKYNNLFLNKDKGYWEPLSFFNLAYAQKRVLSTYRDQPLILIEHIRNLCLEEGQELILLSFLIETKQYWIVRDGLTDRYVVKERSDLVHCRKILYKEYIAQKELCQDSKLLELLKPNFYFEEVKFFLQFLPNPESKINYLLESINKCKQEILKSPKDFPDNCETFLKLCESEIDYLKRFKSEVLNKKVISQSPPINSLNQSTKRDEEEFGYYLKEKGRKIIPFLQERYQYSNAKQLATMLYSLYTADLLIEKLGNINKVKLHKAMIKIFTKVGSRQNLNNYINILNRATDKENKSIELERLMIIEALKI